MFSALFFVMFMFCGNFRRVQLDDPNRLVVRCCVYGLLCYLCSTAIQEDAARQLGPITRYGLCVWHLVLLVASHDLYGKFRRMQLDGSSRPSAGTAAP